MSNEQRAHDLALLYVELLCKFQEPDENRTLKLDPLSKYCEVYPKLLDTLNKKFPN